MSFSFSSSGQTIEVTTDKVENDLYLPDAIKEYLKQGIDALATRYGPEAEEKGEEVLVNASAHGHLFNGEAGWSDVTTANINVSRHVAQ